MPSTYSPKLKFELIGAGEQAGLWGATTNKNLGELVEQAIAGVTPLSLDGASGNRVLESADGVLDEARSAVIVCSYDAVPAVGTVNIIIPTQTKLYLFKNACGQDITVKTVAQTTNIPTILNGESTLIFCDGTNAYYGIQTAAVGTLTVSGGGTGVTSFSPGVVSSPGGTGALSAGAVDLASDVTGTLPVANGGTGNTTFTSGALLLGAGTSAFTTLTGGTVGYVATWNGSAWTASAPTTAGVTSFNGRSGAVTPDSGDYSSYYAYTNGSNASGTWSIAISGNAATATNATTASYINNSSSNGYGTRTISTSAPSGGNNGDIWYKY